MIRMLKHLDLKICFIISKQFIHHVQRKLLKICSMKFNLHSEKLAERWLDKTSRRYKDSDGFVEYFSLLSYGRFQDFVCDSLFLSSLSVYLTLIESVWVCLSLFEFGLVSLRKPQGFSNNIWILSWKWENSSAFHMASPCAQ